MVACLTCPLYSQGEQTSQGGQAPAPQPTPQPQPRQPNAPTPLPNQNPPLRIRGRIIAGPHGIDSSITQVRFETEGGQPIGFAYADSGGEFTFERDGIPLDQTVYVMVNVDGFKPHRERLFGDLRGSLDSFVTIFLEPESGKSVSSKGANIVDLKQLRARVPSKAVDEYEKALKESSKGNR